MCDKRIPITFPTLGTFNYSCNEIKNMRFYLKSFGKDPNEWLAEYKEQIDPFIASCTDKLVDGKIA